MSWVDDFQMRVQQLNNSVPKEIKDAFNQVAKDEFVKFGKKALGNLTPEDIARGETGENPNAGIAVPKADSKDTMNANQASQIVSFGSQLMSYLPFILLGGAALYFLTSKRRG